MKTILSLITAALVATVCYGQDNISVPYATALRAKQPVEYTYHNGTLLVKEKAEVELVVENFSAHHTAINSFADGGLAGGFKCDIVFNTWFSYASPKGFTVDGDFVSFDELGIGGINFTVKDVRFRWTQGVHGQYNYFNMGAPLLPTNPKAGKPGYTGSIYLQLKEMIGDHGSCAKDVQVVKGKGPIVGHGLEIGSISFNPPHELKKYLQQNAEKKVQEEKERKEREDRLYNSGSSGLVLTRSSNASSESSSKPDTKASSNNTTSSSRSNTNTTAKKGYSSRWTKEDNDAWLKRKAAELRRTYGRYAEEPPKQRSIYDLTETTTTQETYFQNKALERKKQEEEAQQLTEQRLNIIREFPLTFQQSKYYNLRGGQQAYCFLYVYPGESGMFVSNVFAVAAEDNRVNGAVLRKEIELSVNRQLAIRSGKDARFQAADYANTTKYIVGPYGSEKDALAALSRFKSRLGSTGVQIMDVQFIYNKKSRSELYKTAINHYEKKEYANALAQFERVALEYDSDPAVYMYIARCLYKTNPLVNNALNNKVIENFNKAIDNGATDEDYCSMAEMFYNFRYNGALTYDFQAAYCYSRAAAMGNQKARQWLEEMDFVIDRALIFYNASTQKYGIKNLQNQVVVRAEYDKIEVFAPGKYKVQKGTKSGVIDKAGKVLLPVQFAYIVLPREGISLVKLQNYRFGYADTAGVFITQNVFYNAQDFSEGLAAVIPMEQENVFKKNWGFIDTSGELVITAQFKDAKSFSEGLAAVEICNDGNCKYGFINKRGEWVIPARFDLADSFKNGKARVVKGRKGYYIDKAGKKLKN